MKIEALLPILHTGQSYWMLIGFLSDILRNPFILHVGSLDISRSITDRKNVK